MTTEQQALNHIAADLQAKNPTVPIVAEHGVIVATMADGARVLLFSLAITGELVSCQMADGRYPRVDQYFPK